LFPRKHIDFKEKSLIPRRSRRGFFITLAEKKATLGLPLGVLEKKPLDGGGFWYDI
jgi:hypothetical protein